MMSIRSFGILTLAIAGCAGSPAVAPVRFANAPPVQAVDDRRDVPKPPEKRGYNSLLYYFDALFHRRLTRGMELKRTQRARGVNALDEVPDSTWFTNRIGVRDLTPDEVRAGATTVANPELHKPWTIHRGKTGGTSVGFVVSDARGEKYLIKFDLPGYPEIETATHVIGNRLIWACGYNVAEDHIAYLRRDELVIAPDAKIEDGVGGTRRLVQADVEAAMKFVHVEPDGRIRALASRFLPGKPLGGIPDEGVRRDDPNDRIPHEQRRDLRGARAIYAWLDHVDIKGDQFIDAWVADPADPKRHYVRHYMIDFGKSLGAMSGLGGDPRRGYEYRIDFLSMFESFVTAGLLPRPWANRHDPHLRGVGMFSVKGYSPGAWTPMAPGFVPFLTSDRIDKFWGSKILMRFTRAQIRAAVEAARLSDPRSTEYFIDTLVARQQATARYWFQQTNPLDRFVTVHANGAPALCFEDLLLSYDLSPGARVTSYHVTSHDRSGRRIGMQHELRAKQDGRACTEPLTIAPGADGYTIVRIETRRPGFSKATSVHLARDPMSALPRVIGVWRD